MLSYVSIHTHRKALLSGILLLLIVSVRGGTAVQAAATLTVCQNGAMYTSVAAAVTAANSGDTIQLCNQTFYPATPIAIDKPLTIEGAVTSENTLGSVIDGRGAIRLFEISGSAFTVVQFRNIVTQFGQTLSDGGAITVAGAATLVIDESEIIEHDANGPNVNGGAIAVTDSANLTVFDSLFYKNSTEDGAGGAIYFASTGRFIMTNTTISDNDADDLGTGRGRGGGVALAAGAGIVEFDHVTFYKNTTDFDAGNFYNAGAASVSITRSIIANGNAHTPSVDCVGTIDILEYNWISNTTGCTVPASAVHLVTGNISVGTLAHNKGRTRSHLPLTAVLLDVADSCGALGKDQRLLPRPHNLNCDLGALEVQPNLTVTYNAQTVAHDAAQSQQNGTHFGDHLLANPNVTHAFVIENIGDIPLTFDVNSYTLNDPNNAFSVSAPAPSATVDSGNAIPLTITFQASTLPVGFHAATLNLNSDDPDDFVYKINLSGSVTGTTEPASVVFLPIVLDG